MRRPTPTIIFIYALTITALAFVLRNPYRLMVVGIPNGIVGIILGFRRFRWIILLLLLAIWGTFLNSLAVANTGDVVASIGPLVIRSGALHATLAISLRLTAIAGAALIFFASTNPRDVVRHLEAELRIPKGVALSIAYALRLFPLMQRDFREIQLARVERGYRRVPVTPSDIKSVLLPLLSMGYERAIWAGIAAELRGFRLRTRRRRPVFGAPEALVIAALLAQAIASMII